MSKKKTHEEYVAELAIKNPNIEVVGEYVGAKTKIMHRCLVHDECWAAVPSNILSGTGCPWCKNEATGNRCRKTHKEYVEELKNISPNIIVLEKYIDLRTSILHKCLIHDVEWKVRPDNILQGCGCSKCKGEKISNKHLKTHERYIEELKSINLNIIALEKYIDANTPILHRCLIDNYEWKTSPHSILNGNGCPKCSNRIRRTHDEYVKDLNNINDNIKVIEKFVNTYTPILHKCIKCDYEWKTSPTQVLSGSSCPQCAGVLKKSHEEYIREVSLINSDIEVIGVYVDAKTPILHRCLIDGYEWFTSPTTILSGKGCPRCGGTLKKTHEEYVRDVAFVNTEIDVAGIYINAKTPVLHRCKIDGCEWYALPSNILKGRGCPQCSESHGEREIRQWLEKYNITYIPQKTFEDCKDIRLLPFDFYLPDYNKMIEYDGRQHFEPIEHFGGQGSFEVTIKHDNIKNEYCKDNGISLLRIPYFKNIEEELNNFLFI